MSKVYGWCGDNKCKREIEQPEVGIIGVRVGNATNYTTSASYMKYINTVFLQIGGYSIDDSSLKAGKNIMILPVAPTRTQQFIDLFTLTGVFVGYLQLDVGTTQATLNMVSDTSKWRNKQFTGCGFYEYDADEISTQSDDSNVYRVSI